MADFSRSLELISGINDPGIWASFLQGKQARFDDNMNRNRLADIARQDAARPLVGQALQGNKNALASLAGIDPQSFMDVGKYQADQSKADQDAKQKQYENIRGVLSGAKDQGTWGRALEFLKSQGVNVPPEYADFRNRDFVLAEADKDAAEFGLTPIWGTDANGNPALYQIDKSGGAAKQVQFGAGFTPNPGVQFLDTGTGFVPANKRTGLPEGVPTIPKDLTGKAIAEEAGQARGKAIAAAPQEVVAAESALSLLDSIKNDPYKEAGTGSSAVFNAIPGTGGYDFQRKVDQATSTAFLQAIQQMRGLGALSNAEGETARQAITRLSTGLSMQAFDKALSEYEAIVKRGLEKAKNLSQQSPLQYPGADGVTGADIGGGFNSGDYTIEEVQ